MLFSDRDAHGDTGAPPLAAAGLWEAVCAAARGAGALRAFWWRPAALAASRGRFARMLFKGFSDRRPVMPKEKSGESRGVKTKMYTYTDDQRYECKQTKITNTYTTIILSNILAIPRKLRVSTSALEFIWMCRFLNPICLAQHDLEWNHVYDKTFLQHADSLIPSNGKSWRECFHLVCSAISPHYQNIYFGPWRPQKQLCYVWSWCPVAFCNYFFWAPIKRICWTSYMTWLLSRARTHARDL